MGRYLSQPLAVKCETIADVCAFLTNCRAVSDKQQFGKEDYWQPPEDFEKSKKGDCDDFALWTWRELLAMGYRSRFVVGRHGKYGIGHAWVTFEKDGKNYLVEPQFRLLGERFPRLSTLRYEPRFSVAWDGDKLSFFSHNAGKNAPDIFTVISLLPEWIFMWGGLWLWALPRIPVALWRLVAKQFRRSRIPKAKVDSNPQSSAPSLF